MLLVKVITLWQQSNYKITNNNKESVRMSINQENQTKKISLLDLRYKKLRKKIGEVEIYNPNKELKLELEKEFTKRITEAFQSDNLNINTTIGMGEMLTMYIPLLTNIDCPEDVLLINEILADPSPILEKVIEEVSEILSEIFTKTANNIIKFAKSTNDVFEDESLTIEQRTEMLRQMELLIDDTPDEEILITDEEIGVEDEI